MRIKKRDDGKIEGKVLGIVRVESYIAGLEAVSWDAHYVCF